MQGKGPIIGSLLLVFCPMTAWAGEGLVALQTAQPSCHSATTPAPIYVDCDNGTVTDNRTGLIWLQDANCLGVYVTWHAQMEFVAGLGHGQCGLSDQSSPGEWRLPSIAEWEAMVADARTPGGLNCSPAITNDEGTGCWQPSCHTAGYCAFAEVQSVYMSATSSLAAPTFVFAMNLIDGTPLSGGKASSTSVWPVRGGQ